jgi:hypothetical protein
MISNIITKIEEPQIPKDVWKLYKVMSNFNFREKGQI